jgi:copper resistance protein C
LGGEEVKTSHALAAWSLFAALATLVPANPVWGHATLVKSSPANGASLAQSPPAIRAWFNEELAIKSSTMRLYDNHQKLVASGGVDSTVAKHNVMKIAPPTLAKGAYVVQWVAVSADDNETRKGSFKFSIGAAKTTKHPMVDLPALRLIAPTNDAQVKNPLTVLVETSADMDHFTMGGGMAGMSGMGVGVHLHILVDGRAFMPIAGQLTKVGPSRYQYGVGSLSAGTHTIKVFWADNKKHGAVGPVHTATCTITG